MGHEHAYSFTIACCCALLWQFTHFSWGVNEELFYYGKKKYLPALHGVKVYVSILLKSVEKETSEKIDAIIYP